LHYKCLIWRLGSANGLEARGHRAAGSPQRRRGRRGGCCEGPGIARPGWRAPAARHHEGTKGTKGLLERVSHATFREGRDFPRERGGGVAPTSPRCSYAE
jgi:hypothetical protein